MEACEFAEAKSRKFLQFELPGGQRWPAIDVAILHDSVRQSHGSMNARNWLDAPLSAVDESLASDQIDGKCQRDADIGECHEEPSPLGPHADAPRVHHHPYHEHEPCYRHVDRKSTRLKLQSRRDLVCRLLLEKKKNKKKNMKKKNKKQERKKEQNIKTER